ncbi:uncharacterized protein [Miscanthus floridulus]|uniref:uncharacterized protein isoform X5 n=1 Tax=Miscanthus floridulus TaxID=154761 RepID=UPI003457ED52
MRNSELGCGGTEQRRGVAVALSCGDAAAQGRWRGEAVTLWRGAANWAARDATGSARGPARRLMTSAHGLGSSMTWKPCQRKSRTDLLCTFFQNKPFVELQRVLIDSL